MYARIYTYIIHRGCITRIILIASIILLLFGKSGVFLYVEIQIVVTGINSFLFLTRGLHFKNNILIFFTFLASALLLYIMSFMYFYIEKYSIGLPFRCRICTRQN